MATEPRRWVLPRGIKSTGWPSIRDTLGKVGVSLDQWQGELVRAMAAKDRHGLFAASIVVIAICRQVGKTFTVGAYVFAQCIIHPGTTVVWTAHRFKVARESFDELKGLASLKAMRAHVDKDAITTAAGNECIPFRNGSRILFAARERGSLRGFTDVRILVIDEGQICTEAAMADMAPTQNHAWNPQTIVMGTPPKPTDPSEVFTAFRAEALSEEGDGDVLYVEYGAEADVDIDDDAQFWAAVEQANPSFPHRTTKRAIRRLRKLLITEGNIRREALGIWDEDATRDLVDMEVWADLEDKPAGRPHPVAFGVSTTQDRRWTHIAVVGRRPDGAIQVQVAKSERGTKWAAAELRRMRVTWQPVGVGVVSDDPAASLIGDLDGKTKRSKVTALSATAYARACGDFVDGVEARQVHHAGGQLLSLALEAGRRKAHGNTFVIVDPPDGHDIAPLRAVLAALSVLKTTKPRSGLVSGIR